MCHIIELNIEHISDPRLKHLCRIKIVAIYVLEISRGLLLSPNLISQTIQLFEVRIPHLFNMFFQS